MSLINIVYVSYETHEMSDDELVELLNECRENNQKLNVTGMLLYHDGFFIQALEGERDTVIDLYNTIKDDPRHNNVLTVYESRIQERSFGEWSMGFNKVSDADLSDIPGYTGTLDAAFIQADHSRAERLLESFRDRTFF